jgi:hypothetical protein
MIVEFRSEDGKPVKRLSDEEMSDEATLDKLLSLEAGDTVTFEGVNGSTQYKVMASERKQLFPLQSADPEPVNYLIFLVKQLKID